MKYSIEERTLGQIAHSVRLSLERYTDDPSFQQEDVELYSGSVVTVTANEDLRPDSNYIRFFFEGGLGGPDEEYFLPFGYCSGAYDTAEEARAAEDYKQLTWEDTNEDGIVSIYSGVPSRSITFVADETDRDIFTPIYIELFVMNDGEEGWTTEEIAYQASHLMPFRELEEIEITENGIYGEDVELGAPAYYKVNVNVPTGGGGDIPEELFYFTGNCQNKFYSQSWNWLINQYGNQIRTDNITNGAAMFDSNIGLTSIPFELNFGAGVNLNQIFRGCSYLEEIAPIHFNASNPFQYAQNLFNGCAELKELPEMENFYATQSQATLNATFANCLSINEIPEYIGDFYSRIDENVTGSSQSYNGTFNNDKSLRELPCVPYFKGILNSNAFNNFVNNCYNLKRLVFKHDGDIPEAKWKSQTINLTTLGWFPNTSGLGTAALNKLGNEVTNDDTYQAYKDGEWWTKNVSYSRYNRESAIETIESLPNCSAYGTNTIQFKGAAGALTDGGAINTLTEEEIAVATAKGWTVTLS